ncbi:uncharacterized protein LOC111700141 [Eurytemora carolleeae]|uniref:uncharacterized protein LOC111700141 n=1 Tax=Eurytemora carolleeae TaxID=1294199 RepID=UPI000C7763C7|nr:uncharacterized protein LOC111700141 [Eurytemora carolleeae]|eukprot:XP_023326729.1 uncharacterized protein LOC111700141 [Eurytemora affinis]
MTSLRLSLSFFYSGCIIVLLFYIVPPVISQGCVQEGTTGAIISYIPMSGAYGQENITDEVCSASCGYAPEAVGYGMTGEGICMCLPQLMINSFSPATGTCGYACPKNPAQICGSYTESNISSEVVTANNSIFWNSVIPPLNAVSFDLKSTFTAPNIVTVALSNVSTGGAAANISFAINEDTIGGGLSSNAVNIVLNQPGDVVVTVRAENSDGVRVSQSKVALVTMPPLTKTILCDVVASDEEDYFCSYSVKYSSGPITAGFASTVDYLTPGANYEYYGNTPQYADPLVAFQSSSVTRTLVFGKRVEEETVVTEIRGYSTASGSIKIKRFTPDCDGNPFEARFRGRCEIDLPYTEKRTTTILTDEIDCKPDYVFVAAEVTCRDPACSISCSELETPNYSKLVGVGGVVNTIPQGYFSIILTEDLRFTVYPGDYLGFEGDTIAVSDETDTTLADIELSADGSMVSILQKSYLQIVTERMNFYDLPNRCASTEIATTLTFSTNDGTNTKTNLTNCQYPIEGLLPMISFSITTVPADIDVNDVNAVYYARVDDVVTLDSTITKGWPVYYTVSWGDGTPDDVLHENGTNAKPQTFTHNFESEGNYTVNITAYNLHSEDYGIVGYKPNTTRTLYIQYPVKEWIIEIDPNWLDSDGAYVAQLVYPDNTPWPTAASYWCDWGVGLPPVTSGIFSFVDNV